MILADWLSGFHAHVEGKNAPYLFKRWAGIYTLASAMQRRIYMLSNSERVYPNFYTVLCGPSGTGKGVALAPVATILGGLEDQHVAPASLTTASLADELEDAHVAFMGQDNRPLQFNPLAIISNELGVFLPDYDRGMMATLTDVYDGKGYSERRRGKGKRMEIPGAHLSIIAGCTPAYLQNTLPEGAWSEGFMSRVILVYGQTLTRTAFIEELPEEQDALTDVLIKDLEELRSRTGRIKWAAPAREKFSDWYIAGGHPVPSHPKLITYCARRHFNLMKLSMVFAISRNAPEIQVEDFDMALDLLLETENEMPEAFKAMKTGGDQQTIEDAWHFLYQLYIKTNKPIPAATLIRFVQERAPSYSVSRIIEVMVAARYVKQEEVNKIGTCYVPINIVKD